MDALVVISAALIINRADVIEGDDASHDYQMLFMTLLVFSLITLTVIIDVLAHGFESSSKEISFRLVNY